MNEQETVYPNMKYRRQWTIPAVVTWVVVYLAVGIVLGRFVHFWLGLFWMILGAIPLAVFEWRCFFPRTLFAHRDGFRVEGRGGEGIALGYERVHEARWEAAPAKWRRLLGPLVFAEPLWPVRRSGDMRLVITHGGAPLVLRDDEFARLAEFVETLSAHNVPGLAGERTPPRRMEYPGPSVP